MLRVDGALPRVVRKSNLAALGSLDPSRTLYEGWLLKECGLMFGFSRWKPRWCVLQPEGLYHFRSRNSDEDASGLILLQDATHKTLGADFTFEVSIQPSQHPCPHPSFQTMVSPTTLRLLCLRSAHWTE